MPLVGQISSLSFNGARGGGSCFDCYVLTGSLFLMFYIPLVVVLIVMF